MIQNQVMKAEKAIHRKEAKMMKVALINQTMKAKTKAHRSSKARVNPNWIKVDHLLIKASEAIERY